MRFKGKNILITGGAGYIGSHAVVRLIEAGAKVVILDNLCNSKAEVLNRIEAITHCRPEFVFGDIRDGATLQKLFKNHKIDAVIHFAGLKALAESIAEPLKYYDTNVIGSIALFQEMIRAGVKTLIFSSSATVYGGQGPTPIAEDFPLNATSPYGKSKLIVEEILRDLHETDRSWKVAILRYFNPVGAHESGLIGEDPMGVPNNLMALIGQVAVGRMPNLQVFGGDYDTPDGSGVRDYIHVDDLVLAHLAALDNLQTSGVTTLNIGTGRGVSVLEMIKAFEFVSAQKITFTISGRRSGDVAVCYADPGLSKKILGWEAKHDIYRMCEDVWRWQSKNPDGLMTVHELEEKNSPDAR